MEKKLTARDVKSNEKKKRIYKAAMALFAKYGYSQVTMKMIAAESGMSEGSIFHFFGEKAGILDYVIHVQDEIQHILLDAMNTDENPKEVIYRYLCKELETYEGLGRDLTSVLLHRSGNNRFPTSGGLSDLVSVIQPALADYIQKNMDNGRLKSRYLPHELAYIITAQGSGLTNIWCQFGENYSLLQNGKKTFEILIDSLFE